MHKKSFECASLTGPGAADDASKWADLLAGAGLFLLLLALKFGVFLVFLLMAGSPFWIAFCWQWVRDLLHSLI